MGKPFLFSQKVNIPDLILCKMTALKTDYEESRLAKENYMFD